MAAHPQGFDFEPGGVARLVLDRPDQRNAVTWQLLRDLLPVLELVDEDDDIRCLVVEGAGGTFCAGMDLGLVSIDAPADAAEVLNGTAWFLSRFEGLRKPVLSRIEGDCIGLGLEIALAGDVLVAAPSARFGFGEIAKGVLPAAAVARHRSWARRHDLARLALSGELVGAEQAYATGLVDVVVDDTAAEAARLANLLASAAPRSMELARTLLHRGAEDDYRRMAEVMPAVLLSEDAAEGARASFDRRPPQFWGR